jgi:glutamate-ammonia-ligase adenylyltransferase
MTPDSTHPSLPLRDRIRDAPIPHDHTRADVQMADLEAACRAQPSLSPLLERLRDPPTRRLLAGIFGCSPYLSGLVHRDPPRLLRLLDATPETYLPALSGELPRTVGAASSFPEAMRALRLFKAEVALLIALCDLGGVWPVMQVTAALTSAADAAVASAVGFLFTQAVEKGDWIAQDRASPEANSGYIVLGMGKFGAGELNYSSDIDLIVFFEPDLVLLKSGIEPLAYFVRMTRDLVRLLQERTGDGYVFRTDLRLRPDPGATHVAMSTPAALNYYQSFRQNWERAALINARAEAGDNASGKPYLQE